MKQAQGRDGCKYRSGAIGLKRTFLMVLAITGTLTTYACECVTLSFSAHVTGADQIFLGKVVRKATADKAYYLFSVSTMFKGEKTDTLTIGTGFGGPDCGMVFEVGKLCLVYSYNKLTTRCSRNALANDNADVVKLKYLFDSTFSANIGETDNPVLSDNEAEYLNVDLMRQRKEFDFYGKKVAFAGGGHFHGKKNYFENWGGRDVVNDFITLTSEEKQKANSYDAIIVSWRKQGVSNRYRKKLIKRLG